MQFLKSAKNSQGGYTFDAGYSFGAAVMAVLAHVYISMTINKFKKKKIKSCFLHSYFFVFFRSFRLFKNDRRSGQRLSWIESVKISVNPWLNYMVPGTLKVLSFLRIS